MLKVALQSGGNFEKVPHADPFVFRYTGVSLAESENLPLSEATGR